MSCACSPVEWEASALTKLINVKLQDHLIYIINAYLHHQFSLAVSRLFQSYPAPGGCRLVESRCGWTGMVLLQKSLKY